MTTTPKLPCLYLCAIAACALSLPACASHASSPSPTGPLLPQVLTANTRAQQRTFGTAPPQQGKIEHIIIVMEENRSFNYLFKGFPGATTASFGFDHTGKKIPLQPVSLTAFYDVDHSSAAYFQACDGQGSVPGTECKMDGFDLEYPGGGPIDGQYAFAPRSEVSLYWQMAKQYALADNMHPSMIDASYVSHQYLIAAQADHEVNAPTSTWGCGGGPHDTLQTINPDRSFGPSQSPCRNYQTLGDLLDQASLPWRYYATDSSDTGYIWSAYQAVKHIYRGADWKANVVTPPSQFLTDVGNGTLADVTWVLPTWETSDHPGSQSLMGPPWVASIVNAVGESPFWKSSAIFVMWDEWGGWFDPQPPPFVDYDGLGIRVPLIMISPYAKQSFVSHVQYEHGSILRFAEDAFGLPQLSASDTRANDPAYDAFDFTQKPRAFKAFKTGTPAGFFQHRPRSNHPIDNE